MKNKNKWVTVGGIINYGIKLKRGYGFKIIFKTAKEAHHYKEMLSFILKNDSYMVDNDKGYYDK